MKLFILLKYLNKTKFEALYFFSLGEDSYCGERGSNF